MIKKIILLFIIVISFFGTYCFAGDNKAPIFQGATDTECIKKQG